MVITVKPLDFNLYTAVQEAGYEGSWKNNHISGVNDFRGFMYFAYFNSNNRQ